MLNNKSALILGVSLIIGLTTLGFLLSDAVLKFKAAERTVTVKGLSERELPAGTVIWPIQFSATGNQLSELYTLLEKNNRLIQQFLTAAGIPTEEISLTAPAITDKIGPSLWRTAC